MKKLPEITLAFWIMKICATTLGETAGDQMSMTMNIGYELSTAILFAVFLAALTTQLFSKKYSPWLFWTVILSTSTVGTTMSDYMDRTLKLGYATGSLILICILLFMLTIWKISEKSLSVDNINTRKGEVFYWITILFSNTLGTALGDYLADDSGLGFAGGAILIASTIFVIGMVGKFTKVSKVAVFWAAFVLTRPLGATMGDVLTKGPEKGGIGIGTAGASLVLLGLLISVIVVSGLHDRKRLALARAAEEPA